MNVPSKVIFPCMMVSGVVFLIAGINIISSFNYDLPIFFPGSLFDHRLWMLMGGLIFTYIGLLLTFLHWRQTVHGCQRFIETVKAHKIHGPDSSPMDISWKSIEAVLFSKEVKESRR